ncbi:MAG: hypothetical protein K8I30_19655 [Anaerolineae bacterium]|nr:hypothetical protein [Anaerolineae bacterium]
MRLNTRFWIAAAVLLALVVGLALDLTNRGLVWQLFWSLTGEESPPAQIQGMVEWAGSLTRPQPRTEALTPIQHTDLNPYGINTFLEQEVEPEKRERILQMIREAGFRWIRQQFPWEDIEIHGRGDFEDRRNDLNGDGQPDAISAWDKYDQIVALAEQYSIQIHARLDNPPAWTHADPAVGTFAPPDDFQDFVNYAAAVAERYKGRIHYYQVWNEPNIYPEWGEQAINPEAYADLLCRTYTALKAVDSEIVVVSGALAATVSLSGRDLSDLVFLQRLYDAGGGECFDILAVQGYGLNSGPTDQRMRPTTLTFARHVYIRDMMVANGNTHKPIWISEAAWNPVESPDVPPDVQGHENYGSVTQEQAARYMPLAYQRAQEEWPWVGVIFYWFFKRPADYERSQSWYYFRMVEPDFTPLPVYDSMKTYITGQQPVLYPGVHQAEHWAVQHPDSAEVQPAAGAQFDHALQTEVATFTTTGTAVEIRWSGSVSVEMDGVGLGTFTSAETSDWQRVTLHTSLFPEKHTFHVFSEDGAFHLDTITVLDRTYQNGYPLAAGALIFVGMMVYVVVSAWRARRK